MKKNIMILYLFIFLLSMNLGYTLTKDILSKNKQKIENHKN